MNDQDAAEVNNSPGWQVITSCIVTIYEKLSHVAPLLLLCAAAVGVYLRLSGNLSRLTNPGDYPPLANISFPLLDLALYQTLILSLSALLARLRPRFIKRLIEGVINLNPTVFLTSVFLFVLIAANLISYLILEHSPRDVDDLGKMFQAQVFASGRLYAPAPPVPEAFRVNHIAIKDGKMFSVFEPGSSLVYALWQSIFGTQWGANPFLGATILLVFYWTIRSLYGELVARSSVLLLSLSPFFLFMTSSLHSQVPSLFFLTLFVLCLTHGCRCAKAYHLLLAGFCLGMAFATRPYSTLLVSLPFGVWLFTVHNHFRRTVRDFLLVTIGFAVPLGALLYYNSVLTGHPLVFPVHARYPNVGIGFGYMGHTPLRAVRQTVALLEILNLNLFGWPSSLFFAGVFIAFGKKRRWDILLLGSVLCLIIGHALYVGIDFSFGARYYFEIAPFLVVLTARGMISFPDYVQRLGFVRANQDKLENFCYYVVLLSFLFSFIFYMHPLTYKYHNDYNNFIDTKVARLARREGITNALVLMREPDSSHAYKSGFLANAVDFQGDIVYARDDGEESNEAIIAAYPGRMVLFFEFDRRTRVGRFVRPGRCLSGVSEGRQNKRSHVEEAGSLAGGSRGADSGRVKCP